MQTFRQNKISTSTATPEMRIILEQETPKPPSKLKKAAKIAGVLALTVTLLALAVERSGLLDAKDYIKDKVEDVKEAFKEPPNKVTYNDAATVWRALQGQIEYRKTVGAGYCPKTNEAEPERICQDQGLKINYDNPRVSWLPSIVAGDRAEITVVGKVNAAVSFSGLAGNAVRPSGDAGLVIDLPRSELLDTYVDPENTSVSRRFGIANEVLNFRTGEKRIRVCAEKSLTQHALSRSDILNQTEIEAANAVKGLAVGILAASRIPATADSISVRFVDDASQVGTFGPLPSAVARPVPPMTVPQECLGK